MAAGGNLTLDASNVTSTNGAITLAATGNVTLGPVATASSAAGTSVQQAGTTVSGNSVLIWAANDLNFRKTFVRLACDRLC